MEYLGWNVSHQWKGQRVDSTLIGFYDVPFGAHQGVYALCFNSTDGSLRNVKVVPDQSDFRVDGTAYRPTLA